MVDIKATKCPLQDLFIHISYIKLLTFCCLAASLFVINSLSAAAYYLKKGIYSVIRNENTFSPHQSKSEISLFYGRYTSGVDFLARENEPMGSSIANEKYGKFGLIINQYKSEFTPDFVFSVADIEIFNRKTQAPASEFTYHGIKILDLNRNNMSNADFSWAKYSYGKGYDWRDNNFIYIPFGYLSIGITSYQIDKKIISFPEIPDSKYFSSFELAAAGSFILSYKRFDIIPQTQYRWIFSSPNINLLESTLCLRYSFVKSSYQGNEFRSSIDRITSSLGQPVTLEFKIAYNKILFNGSSQDFLSTSLQANIDLSSIINYQNYFSLTTN